MCADRQFDTRIVAIRLSVDVRSFVDKWIEKFIDVADATEQNEFTRLVFVRRVPTYVLPPVWSCVCDSSALVPRSMPWLVDDGGRVAAGDAPALVAAAHDTPLSLEQCVVAFCDGIASNVRFGNSLDELKQRLSDSNKGLKKKSKST